MSLHIVVCIKQVLETSLPLQLDQANHVTNSGKEAVYIVNPADRGALEAAIAVKRAIDQVTISVVTVGPEIAEQALHYCLAQGADKAIHLLSEDSNNLDSFQTSFMLSKVLSELNYDLILCGNMSIDSASSQVGASLAELLDLPQITDVIHFEINSERKQAKVQRRLEKGRREILSCSLPAVFTVDKLINEPHYVSIHNCIIAAKQKVVKKSLDSVGIGTCADIDQTLEIANITLPKPRPKRTPEMNKAMTAAERQMMLMQGGLGKTKQTEYLEGTPDQIAVKVMEHLKNAGVLSD